jgi:hypothetical protein
LTDDWAYDQGFEILANRSDGAQRSLLYIPGDGSQTNFYSGASFGNSVGIGTTNPQGNLQIIGQSGWDRSTTFCLTNGSSDYGRTNFVISGRIQSGNDGWAFGSGARNSIVFAENAASSGQSIGNVGTEQYSIQVEGNSNALGFLSSANGNTPNMVLLQNGNVGIGMANPQYRLDVLTPHGSGVNNNNVYGSNGDSHYFIVGKQAVSYFGGYSTVRMNLGTGFSEVQVGSSNLSQSVNLLVTGNVGIGTTNPTEKLSVNGNIRSQKLIVTQTGWSDYVFDSTYQLKPLTEIEQFIKDNKHLPDVPSAKEVEKAGIDVGENQAVLLKKIEELTLYMIEMKKDNAAMEKEIEALQKENAQQKIAIQQLQSK